MHPYKIKCKTCKKMKHDTAFNIDIESNTGLDTSKCLDCIDPNRWDGVREGIKEKFKL